jgi:hypothetical protein
MIDPAFLDRLHFYLPGWEAPKLEKKLFTDHFGFVSDYFAEALRQMRKQDVVGSIPISSTRKTPVQSMFSVGLVSVLDWPIRPLVMH